MNHKIKKIFILGLTPLLLTGCSILYDDSSKKEPSQQPQIVENDDEFKIPTGTTNEGIVLEESRRISLEPVQPYYKAQLSDRSLEVYDEIIASIQKFENSVILSKPINQNDIKQIMRVILFEEAHLFHLNDKYGYTVNSDGTISTIDFNYLMDKTAYEKENEEVKEMVASVANKKMSEIELQNKIFKKVSNSKYDANSTSAKNNSILGFIDSSTTTNSLSTAKLVAYLFRSGGVEATINGGEVISNDMINTFEIVKKSGNPKMVENVTTTDAYTEVTYDYGSLYFWNMVKLNGKWYNFDVPYIKNTSKITGKNSEMVNSLYNVPDKIISMSRLSGSFDGFLGYAPAAQVSTFQYYYMRGEYVTAEKYRDSEQYINNIFDYIVDNNQKTRIFQFENLVDYNNFKNNVVKMIDKYALNNTKSIESYEIVSLDSSATIMIKDIGIKN